MEMDKTGIEGAFRCCALGTRKRLVVFSVCSYIIQFTVHTEHAATMLESHTSDHIYAVELN